MSFERKLEGSIIKRIKKEPLYRNKLINDIKNGEVFPAIRKKEIAFYHKGGKLFSYDRSGFKTNVKFASVFNKGREEMYIKQEDLKHIEAIKNFIDGYDRIKENCYRYSKSDESDGVAEICEKHSYVNTNNSIVVLDVETSFESSETKKRQDRIDLLLLDKRKNVLRFYEAKDFSNSEIWSKIGKKPKVVEQISRYKKQVKKRKEEIISAYNDYINIVNNLFYLDLKEIEDIDPDVYLLIFGFDSDQLRGRFKKFIKDDNSLEGIYVYPIGNVSSLKKDHLWSCPKLFKN